MMRLKQTNSKDDGKSMNIEIDEGDYRELLSSQFIVVTRCAERVDRVFPEWLTTEFDNFGRYQPRDLNLPTAVIKRPEGSNGFVDDPPITNLGMMNSQIIGRNMKMNGMWPISAIYVSPSLRCIETAQAIIRGTGASEKEVEISIEPNLFDYLGWYEKLPSFLPSNILKAAGNQVNGKNKPSHELEKFVGKETFPEFYSRIDKAISEISRKPNRMMFVVHATVMDAIIKSLKQSDGKKIGEHNFHHLGSHYPFNSTFTLARKEEKWSYVHDPIPALSYLGTSNRVNSRFIERTTKPKRSGAHQSAELSKN
ncbi:hypothetical protein M3Y96_00471100 [Aphelenchoides besseyi]|nr:hypothetical protein M3Y96_00471100 [Aphelenchoides besseyi]